MTVAKSILDSEELLTLDEFALVDFDEVVELKEGRVKFMGNNNPSHSKVLMKLGALLNSFLQDSDVCGDLFGGDVSVVIRRDPDTIRSLDLAFVSSDRLKDQPVEAAALQVAPELAIEIMSPSNTWDDVMTKIEEYFEIGVTEVWIISLAVRKVTVFKSPNQSKSLCEDLNESVSCPDILPGFELSLVDVFEGLPPRVKS